MKLETIRIEKLKPYENNPRDNEHAIEEVKQSIDQVGYVTPIVVDEDYEILAGHTRFKAIKELGWAKVQVVIKEGLSEPQKKKYRLLDNKVGEAASWNLEKLEQEIAGLDFGDLDLDWGIGDQEIDTDFLNTEFGLDSFGDEAFKYECPCCGFRFNHGKGQPE